MVLLIYRFFYCNGHSKECFSLKEELGKTIYCSVYLLILRMETVPLLSMLLVTESEAKVVYKESPFIINDFVVTTFIGGAPMEENTAMVRIRTVAVTYGFKILQLYEYKVKYLLTPRE